MKTQRLENSPVTLARRILTAAVALALWIGAPVSTHAQTALTGSGINIPLGPDVNPFPAVGTPFVDNGGGNFTGTWSSPAQANWVGAFTVTGVDPRGNSFGLSTYDFSTLPTAVLPTGSWFVLGDLDNGSGSLERITFVAYDAFHAVITSPWLDSPALAQKDGLSPGNPVSLTDMPGWNWDAGTSTYSFDGSNVPGNPNIALALGNNQAITYLDANINGSSSSFVYHIEAPTEVPEPSTVAMLVGGLGVMSFVVRRRSQTAA